MGELGKQLQDKPVLVGTLVLLLLAKFVVMPLLEWQNDMLLEYKYLKNRLNKENQILNASSDNAILLEKLNANISHASELYYSASSEVEFKLERQQHIESLLTDRKLSLSSLAWEPAQTIPHSQLKKFDATMVVSGNGVNLINFIIHVESKEKFGVAGFNLDLTQPNKHIGKLAGRVELYFYQEVNDE
jgi:hypothetical protein